MTCKREDKTRCSNYSKKMGLSIDEQGKALRLHPIQQIFKKMTTEETNSCYLSQALNIISDPVPLSSTLTPRRETRFAIRSGISQADGTWNLIVTCKNEFTMYSPFRIVNFRN